MNGAQLILDSLERNYTNLHHELEDITLAELMAEPYPSIGWLAWHLVRVQDVQVSMLADREQAWTGDGWHAKFGMPPEPMDYGPAHTHTREQVAGLETDSATLLAYHDAAYRRSTDYLAGVSDLDLERVLQEPRFQPLPTVGVRLVSVVNDNTLHVGQIIYNKACLRSGGWFPNPRQK